jgi:hypothetical protein
VKLKTSLVEEPLPLLMQLQPSLQQYESGDVMLQLKTGVTERDSYKGATNMSASSFIE